MFPTRTFVTALILSATFSGLAAAQPVNEIVDPNFTNQTAPAALLTISGSSSRTVSNGSHDTITVETATDGNFPGAGNASSTPAFADFVDSTSGTTGDGTITYTFATIAGDRYVFSFDFGVYGNIVGGRTGRLTYALTLDGGATTIANGLLSSAGTTDFANIFQAEGGNVFIGDGSVLTLTFSDKTVGGNGANVLLSNVQVVDVPEPITASLFGSALIGLIGARRRFRV